MHSLQQLLQEQLRDLYDAEVQYYAKLPEMIRKATSHDLLQGLVVITEHTSDNISQSEEACHLLDTEATGITCQAMRGLIREVNETTAESGDTATIDASLIANAQRIAHYEIAGFGTARAFAKSLGKTQVVKILNDLTARAGLHDQMLTKIATGGWFTTGVNDEAAERAKAELAKS
jgi:ferritin-like metal-binding protein YciE